MQVRLSDGGETKARRGRGERWQPDSWLQWPGYAARSRYYVAPLLPPSPRDCHHLLIRYVISTDP